MNRVALACLLALTFAACGEDNVAPPPATPVNAAPPPTLVSGAPAPPAHVSRQAPKAPIALDEYFKTTRVRGLSFSYDEKLVATMSDVGGRPDLWVEPVAGGPATQITHVEGFIHSFAFSPTADVLAFEADKGGDELPHLYLTNSKGDSPKDVVADLPAGRRPQFVEWARDGKTLLYLSSARDEKQLDLSEYDVKSGKSKLLWQSDGVFSLNSVSHDHRRIVVVENKGDANNDLYSVDLAKPTAKKLLTAHTGDVLYDASFTDDGRSLLLTSDEKGEFRALFMLDLASGNKKVEH